MTGPTACRLRLKQEGLSTPPTNNTEENITPKVQALVINTLNSIQHEE